MNRVRSRRLVRSASRNTATVSLAMLVCTWIAVSTCAAHAAADRISPPDAQRFIAGLGADAITILRQPNTTLEQREAVFRRLLADKFDLRFLSRFVLGKHARRASQEQSDEYQELFSEFVLRTYASRLGGYAGQAFTVEDAVAGGARDIVVRSLITGGSGPPLRADWRVRLIEGQPRIIDVSVEGISMAITQREEFSAVIANNGIEGLLQVLRARANRMPAESGR